MTDPTDRVAIVLLESISRRDREIADLRATVDQANLDAVDRNELITALRAEVDRLKEEIGRCRRIDCLKCEGSGETRHGSRCDRCDGIGTLPWSKKYDD